GRGGWLRRGNAHHDRLVVVVALRGDGRIGGVAAVGGDGPVGAGHRGREGGRGVGARPSHRHGRRREDRRPGAVGVGRGEELENHGAGRADAGGEARRVCDLTSERDRRRRLRGRGGG